LNIPCFFFGACLAGFFAIAIVSTPERFKFQVESEGKLCRDWNRKAKVGKPFAGSSLFMIILLIAVTLIDGQNYCRAVSIINQLFAYFLLLRLSNTFNVELIRTTRMKLIERTFNGSVTSEISFGIESEHKLCQFIRMNADEMNFFKNVCQCVAEKWHKTVHRYQ
jgi:hypothetical protein